MTATAPIVEASGLTKVFRDFGDVLGCVRWTASRLRSAGVRSLACWAPTVPEEHHHQDDLGVAAQDFWSLVGFGRAPMTSR